MRIEIETNDISKQEALAIIAFLQTLIGEVQTSLTSGVVPVPSLDPALVHATERPSLAPAPSVSEEEPEGGEPADGVDSEGLPWDERIHAGSKTTVKDGTWKLKRGVSDDLVSQIKAELRQGDSAPAFVPPAPVADAAPVPPPPVAPAAPPPPAPAPVQAEPTFFGLMQAVNAAAASDPTANTRFAEAVKEAGLPSPVALNRPDNAHLIPVIAQSIGIAL